MTVGDPGSRNRLPAISGSCRSQASATRSFQAQHLFRSAERTAPMFAVIYGQGMTLVLSSNYVGYSPEHKNNGPWLVSTGRRWQCRELAPKHQAEGLHFGGAASLSSNKMGESRDWTVDGPACELCAFLHPWPYMFDAVWLPTA